MTKNEFWKIIDLIDRAVLLKGDEDISVHPILDHLLTLPEEEIRKFDEILHQYLQRMDKPIYIQEAVAWGHSDDGYLYARCWVIALGREHYNSVIYDPTLMPKESEEWCELLLYCATQALEIISEEVPV